MGTIVTLGDTTSDNELDSLPRGFIDEIVKGRFGRVLHGAAIQYPSCEQQ